MLSSKWSIQLWLGGLAGWSIIPRIRKLCVQSPVRAHNQVAGSIPGWSTYGGDQSMFLSHPVFVSLSVSFSLPLSLKSMKNMLGLGKKKNGPPTAQPVVTIKATRHVQSPMSQEIVNQNWKGCRRLTFVYGSLRKKVLWSYVRGWTHEMFWMCCTELLDIFILTVKREYLVNTQDMTLAQGNLGQRTHLYLPSGEPGSRPVWIMSFHAYLHCTGSTSTASSLTYPSYVTLTYVWVLLLTQRKDWQLIENVGLTHSDI